MWCGWEVKGIFVSWSNDPLNMKIKDWNATELKVRILTSLLVFLMNFFSSRWTLRNDTSTNLSLQISGRC